MLQVDAKDITNPDSFSTTFPLHSTELETKNLEMNVGGIAHI